MTRPLLCLAATCLGGLLAACTIPTDRLSSDTTEDTGTVVTEYVTSTETTSSAAGSRGDGSDDGAEGASTSTATTLREQLAAAVSTTIARHGGTAGIAVSDGTDVSAAGDLTAVPAWSTIKVPLAVAAVRTDPSIIPLVNAAIQISDNPAAESLWQLAGPEAVDEVLVDGGSSARTNRQVLRPEFSVFGQTAWAPADQALFVANLGCIDGAEPVLSAMSDVDPSQRWGLGTVPGARFKGGWGPDPTGVYTARQVGLIPSAGGEAAVSIVVTPASGMFSDAQQMASTLTGQLATVAELPVAQCFHQ